MRRTGPRWLGGAVLLVLALFVTGCGWFDDPSPQEARLTVQGDAGVPVRVIVSREFVAAINEVGVAQVELFTADTFDVALPFDRTFDVRARQIFFSQVERLEVDTDVRVRVLLDDVERFNRSGPLRPDGPFRFVFMFNKLASSTVEVL